MYSDTCGGRGGDVGVENNPDMKKAQPRRQKIPKRGPGVAELEKILKEQEGRDLAISEPDELSPPPFLFSLPHSSSYYNHHHSQSLNPPRPPPPPLPPPPPIPTVNPSSLIVPWTPHVPMVRNLDHIASAPPTRTAVSTGSLIGCGDGGSGVHLSEKALFPTTIVERSKSDTAMTFHSHFSHIQSNIPAWSSPSPPLRENNLEYFPSMVNYIPCSASSSSSASSLSSAAAARLFHQIEHPSSQRSTNYHNLSILPEEEKMVSAKRLRHLSVESHADPTLHSKAPIFPNMAMKESSSSSSSSLEMNHSAFNLDLMGTNLRDTRRGFPSQLISSTKSNSKNQPEDSNFITLGSVAIPSPPPSTQSSRHELKAFNFLPPQENMEDSQQRAGASGSDYNKMFSLVFQSKGNVGSKETTISIGSYKETAEAEGDGIDLNLKL